MYDRYTISATGDELEKSFGIKVPSSYKPSFNAAPTSLLPVLTMQHPEKVALFRWGFISSLSNNKSISPKLFNLSALSVFERPMYREALAMNRCVILADGFYAWKQVSKKQRIPQYFYFPNRTPFGIAGIWEASEDLEGHELFAFNMLTTPSNTLMRGFQEDMPIILSNDQIEKWLQPDPDMEVLKTISTMVSTQGIQIHPVSPRIENPHVNDEDLIKATTPSDQFGNYTLFN